MTMRDVFLIEICATNELTGEKKLREPTDLLKDPPKIYWYDKFSDDDALKLSERFEPYSETEWRPNNGQISARGWWISTPCETSCTGHEWQPLAISNPEKAVFLVINEMLERGFSVAISTIKEDLREHNCVMLEGSRARIFYARKSDNGPGLFLLAALDFLNRHRSIEHHCQDGCH